MFIIIYNVTINLDHVRIREWRLRTARRTTTQRRKVSHPLGRRYREAANYDTSSLSRRLKQISGRWLKIVHHGVLQGKPMSNSGLIWGDDDDKDNFLKSNVINKTNCPIKFPKESYNFKITILKIKYASV